MPVTDRQEVLAIEFKGKGSVDYVRASYGQHGAISASYGDAREMASFMGMGPICPNVFVRGCRVAWIDEVRIADAGQRGKGIGARMLSCFLDFLKERGVGVAVLMATPEREEDLTALLRFYARAGFVPISSDAASENSPIMSADL